MNDVPARWPVYRIVRFYRSDRQARTIKNGLTLKEAQAHCGAPTTRKEGMYFDGYDLMKGFKRTT